MHSVPRLKDGSGAANHNADQNLKPCSLRITRHRSEAGEEQRPVWASDIHWTEGKESCIKEPYLVKRTIPLVRRSEDISSRRPPGRATARRAPLLPPPPSQVVSRSPRPAPPATTRFVQTSNGIYRPHFLIRKLVIAPHTE